MGSSNHFLNSKEGLTQGYPLAIITYGIRILLIIHELCDAQPHINQPRYANYAGVDGTFLAMKLHLEELMVQDPQ